MKKILIALFLIAMMSTPAFALFTNGGFEDGNFNGWTIEQGYNMNNAIAPTFNAGSSGYGTWYAPQVITNSTPTDSYHYPYLPSVYNGTKMAVLGTVNFFV